jgi:hypothetical protein
MHVEVRFFSAFFYKSLCKKRKQKQPLQPRVVDKQVQRYDISIFFALKSECENHSCSVVLSQMASNRLIFVDVRK